LTAEARYLTWMPSPGGTADGRRAEFVEKTTTPTDGMRLT
jgi:hypothetical protein